MCERVGGWIQRTHHWKAARPSLRIMVDEEGALDEE